MRKLCRWAVSCSAALCLAVFLLPGPVSFFGGVLCTLLLPLTRLLKGRRRTGLFCVLLGLACGLLWYHGYQALFVRPAQALIGTQSAQVLRVEDYPTATNYGVRLTARLELEGRPDPLVEIYANESAGELRPGDRVTGELEWRRADLFRGVASDYNHSRGIYLLGYGEELTLTRRPEATPIPLLPKVVAKTLKDTVAEIFPGDISGFVTALLTGDKSLLPDGLYAAFRRAGMAHIIAVSGMHISFFCAMMTTLLGKGRRFSAAATILLLFFFAAVAGNSPSALRAAFMQAILLLAPLVDREEDKPTSLSFVLALLLLQCPYAAASVSLQLSFAAVAGIYLITGPLYSRWLKKLPKWKSRPGRAARKVLVFICGTLATTLGALLFTTPLTAWHFRSVSLVGPLTNLLTLWAVSDAFIGGLIAACVGVFLPGAGALPAGLAAWPARWVVFVAEGMGRLPFSSLSLTTVYLLGWFVVTYTTVLLCLFARGHRPRPVIPISVSVITLCAALIMSLWPAHSGAGIITALDVGQGSSTLFYSEGRAVLVDCGGNSADDPGDVAADYVQSLGLSRLDALILTHCHADHANGVRELLHRLEIPLIILPKPEENDLFSAEIAALAEENSCEVKFLYTEDLSLSFGSMTMRVFAPLGDGGENEAGLSILNTFGDFDTLITGDANSIVESRIVKYKDLPDIELLVVGHHGSKGSTSEKFLLATTPEYAVISSGYNTYGHPAPETLERLGAAGCEIYLTHEMGNITFTIDSERKTDP